MTKKEGKELATVKVYLNTGIIAGLIFCRIYCFNFSFWSITSGFKIIV